MAHNDQSDFPLPTGGSNNATSSDFLPKYFRTSVNKKFLSSTMDQMIKPGVVEKVNAFAGRRHAKAATSSDVYLSDVLPSRENYQLEPSLLYKDDLNNIEFFKNYNDYIGQISSFKGTVDNHSLLNSQEFYAWDPHICWDKFVNFREYYWLPMGPQPIGIAGQSRDVVSTYTVVTSDEGDNTAYIFTPNGLTRNPSIKLFKGQTYRFEVNTPGHPIAFVTSRNFLDTDPTSNTDYLNQSTLYKKGITSDSDYVENGVIEFTVPDDAPAVLYYVSQNDINTSGIVTIFEISENTQINVTNEIIGKKTYKTSSGVELSNGMKVYFQGSVIPEEYETGYWYISGVGSEIYLVSERNLEVPAIFTQEYEVPFDNDGFDNLPFEDATSFPGTKDYIVINRASADKNPWSRYNRWFHRSVIETSFTANNLPVELDENNRAKRPIIEFEGGLKLWKHGTKAKNNVTLIDTYTQDAFSKIEGALGYNIDGIDLVEGMRVIFSADTDILVNGRVYEVKFITHNGRRQISLIEAADSVPQFEDVVLITDGLTYKGKMFYYDGSTWKQSQEKLSVNQFPRFDLFDENGYSYGDTSVYTSSNFSGNKVFSYKEGTGTVDPELGFPLSYRNINNVGDIIFEFNLLNDSIIYQTDSQVETDLPTDTAFLKKFKPNENTFSYVNGWTKAKNNSKQYVIRQFTVSSINESFKVDVFNNSGDLSDLEVKVYVNSVKQKNNIDYVISVKNGYAFVEFLNNLTIGDIVLLKCYSSASKNQNGFYEIPSNLERNPLNDNVTYFTLGEVNDHVNSIVENVPGFTGSYPGVSNLRDLSPASVYGTRFVQHSGPLNIALYHITDKNANIIKSLKYARKEYAKFKRKFLLESEQTGYVGPTKSHFDLVIDKIVKENIGNKSFYFSDMLGFGAAKKTIHTVEYVGPAYFSMSKVFNLDSLSINAVGVYLNGNQLLYSKDYTFTENYVYINRDLQYGDIVEIYEYESTAGSNIPPTPTKLGLYPKFEPSIFVDNTYSEPKIVIQGHDGSLTIGFGDYRDDLLLELETRIYNNIKILYDTDKLNLDDFVGSINRNTGFSKTDIDNVLLSDFAQWLELAGSPNYADHSWWDKDVSFTYNYSSMSDRNGNPLKGYWRNVYKEYFDTDRPHSHPWEMLGFNIKPTWWESLYGPAPYTKDNLILWNDLAEGIIREPGKPVSRNKKYARPGLLDYIPVNEYGQLLSPLDSSLAQDFVLLESKNNFVFGDISPVETAWRRSSEYPFSLITAWVLLQPTKLLGVGFDLSRMLRDNAGNLVYKDTKKRINLKDLKFPTITTTENLVLTSGLVNYISSYISSKVTSKYETYKTQLANLDNQLALKLSGYADKSKLKLVLDSRNPLNKTSVFIPDENYQITLAKSSVLETVVFSGIIIEKIESGYLISGYDKEDPIFYYNKPITRSTDSAIAVGGISEQFVEWDSNKNYTIGIVVRYNSEYYRTKVTHLSDESFDPLKFVKLSGLPVVGGVTALLRKEFETQVTAMPYGSILTTVQDVVDFMQGYEAYLVSKGFVFNFYNKNTEALEDMLLCIKEYMFWVTQNWDNGTVLTVSPVANKVEFSRDYFVVDDIFDSFYDYSLISGNGSRISKEFSNIFRTSSNTFGVTPVNSDEGIFLVKLPLIQKEHVIIIDNQTVFNDTIYDKVPGYRQERIKVVGYRTDNWDGSLNIPGFIFDEAKITNWSIWTDYAIGDLVKYKEFYYSANIKHTSNEFFDANNWNRLTEKPESRLYANWDYKANQFADFYDLDTDNFDTEQQRLGQHLIGYQKREYLSNIITDSVSQYKFYQGYIAEKGTKNALTKLFDALSTAGEESLEFYEEWAVRLGQYGSTDNIYEIEYLIDELKYKLEPQIIELVDSKSSTRTDLVQEIAPYEVYLRPDDYNHAPFESNTTNTIYTKDNGYIREQDVAAVVNGYDSILELSAFNIRVGDFIWVTNYNQTWDVLRLVKTGDKILSFDSAFISDEVIDENGNVIEGFTVVFENYIETQYQKGEIIGLLSTNDSITKFYKIWAVSLNKVQVINAGNLNSITTEGNNSSVGLPDSNEVGVAKFVTRRFADSTTLNSSIKSLKQEFNDTVWIDNKGDNAWGVYTNENIFSLQEEIINPTLDGDGFATSFDSNIANTILAIGSVSDDFERGIVRIYARSTESIDKREIQSLVQDDTVSGYSAFGYDVALSSNGKYLAIGAPYASNIKTKFKGDLTPGTVYQMGDIVNDNGMLWRAISSFAPWDESSTISTTDQDWEPVYIIETTDDGTESGLTNQGVVYLYERQTTGYYNLVHCIASPDPKNNERFGYKVELRTTATGDVKLFVGAPGTESLSRGRIYFIDNSDNTWEYSKDKMYRGVYSDFASYNLNEIVFYNGQVYRADTNITPGSAIPEASSLWILLDDETVEYTGYIPRINNIIDNEGDSSLYNDAINIGKNFDVNTLGDIIILSSSVNLGSGIRSERVSIYRNNLSRWKFSQHIDTSDMSESFGFKVSINDTGDRIGIGAPRNDDIEIDGGCVYIYKQVTTDNVSTYELLQTLRSPFEEKNESFGTGLDFYGNKLAISGKNTDKRVVTTFDRYTENLYGIMVGKTETGSIKYSKYVNDPTSDERKEYTTFDNGYTNFVNVLKDTGRIALFQKLGDSYIYGEDVAYNRNTKYNDISNFKLIDNHLYIGFPKLNPANTEDSALIYNYESSEDSSLGLFADLRSTKNSNSWTEVTIQEGKPNNEKIQRCFLYSINTNDLLVNLDVIDPRQGKIPGPAEQEITWKTFYDPAIYSFNVNQQDGVVVDTVNSWTESQVGKLWWKLETASWFNPYQGDDQYRISNWNKLLPGASIDVYEWVESTVIPSRWAALADTPSGFAEGISGQPLYDDTIYSSKKVYDPVSGSFVDRFYFWVKSKKNVPENSKRQLSASAIENLIADPAGQGYRFAVLLSDNSFALYNVKTFIEDKNTAIHFTIAKDETLNSNIHSEYQLITEGYNNVILNSEIENKWVDSLVGYDQNSKNVPDSSLTVRQKYGILNAPRQGMFVNRLEAVKQLVERTNSVLITRQIVDNYDISTLFLKDEEPAITTGRYDSIVDTVDDLRFVGVSKTEQAQLTPVIENGKIISINIDNPGRGYRVAPNVEIVDSNGTNAIVKTTINNLGQITSTYIRSSGKNYTDNVKLNVRKYSVLVKADAEIGGRWAIYEWNKATQTWNRKDNQNYDTTRYWDYADWYLSDYTSLTQIDHVVDQSYELFGLDDEIGEVIKINNIGSGGWLLLEKIADSTTEDYTVNYKTVGRQNGTIQLSTRLYDYASINSGYDANVFDLTFYDKEPVNELRNILSALKNEIFIGDLAVEYINLFFASLRYAIHEQHGLDWAFKTSFVRVKHNVGNLHQPVNFQNDNLENYQDYVNEVKPYSTKVREYISAYSSIEPTESLVTDFDLPPSYNEITKEIETSYAKYENNQIQDVIDKYLQYPYRSWTENNGYDIVSIEVANGGSKYKETPVVVVEGENGTTAKAYLSRGRVSKIEIVNKGGKYYKAPLISINGTQDEGGEPAVAVAILGNGVVRSAHVVLRFDRISSSYLFTELEETESFVGTAAKEKFVLKWPMNVRTDSYVVTINGIQQLSSKFVIGNDIDKSKGFDRHLGYIKFVDAPALGSQISITYKKDISLLHAADRINFFYNPTTGMAGKDLSQLMDGVTFEGVNVNSVDFGTEQGFGVGGYGSMPWDTFDNTYEDEIFILDGSTSILTLSKPLELNVEYNFYLNNIRLDDENYGTSTPLSNLNAKMATIIGDGVTDTVTIDEELIETVANDIVIIRKSTSDGSFAPTDTSYDTSISGGNFAYTTATGLSSADITIDGDGFVTASSRGPEELVPGQVLDTLDLKVYHRSADGVGIVTVANYKIDGTRSVFDLPNIPQTADGIIVKVDNQILKPDMFTVDYEDQTISFSDSTIPTGSLLSILTIGVNGANLIDTEYTISDGSTTSYVTSAVWSETLSTFVTVNGIVKEKGRDYNQIRTQDTEQYPNRLKIVFESSAIANGDLIQYSIYDTPLKTYSQIIIDRTFEADGSTDYHDFDGTDNPVPFNKQPLAYNLIVKSNNQILSPGYSKSFITTDEREYAIDSWQYSDTTTIDEANVLVFVNGIQLTKEEFTFDSTVGIVRLLQEDIGISGSTLEVYIITDADYYFIDSRIKFSSAVDSMIVADSEITLVSTNDSSSYTAYVKTVSEDEIVVRSFRNDIRNSFTISPEFELSETLLTILDVTYELSDSLTFATPPSSGTDIEIYQFSNHDINNFKRTLYKVLRDTYVDETTENWITRNLTSSGYIKLNGTTSSANYVWVALNGELLTPNIDYVLVPTMDAIQLSSLPFNNDKIDVIEFGNSPVSPKYGFRIFKDMLNRTHYKRLNQSNSYVLAEPLNYYDLRIVLESTSGIFQPNKSKNIPGVVFIDGERIEYFEVVGNKLQQLRRGTLGTGVKNLYNVGTVAYGQGPEETINYSDVVLTQTEIADGSSTATTFAFRDYMIPESVDEIEVFVAGRRLRKNSIQLFDQTIAQDSPEGDVTIPPEFSIEDNNLVLAIAPPAGVKVVIARSTGKVWNESGKSLTTSNNNISRFLREATILLPK
jgi:hypothetical protein